MLVLYSDGVTEATNLNYDEFGEQRLIDTLKAHRTQPATAIVEAVTRALAEFTAGAPQSDDVTILTVQYKGGEQKVLVPGNAKVVLFAPGERSALKKGAHIFSVTQRQPDGSLTAARVNVGVKGTVPPM